MKVGSYTILSVKVPLFQGIFKPYDPLFMAYFGSIFFANVGGGGGQNYFKKRTPKPNNRANSAKECSQQFEGTTH